MADHTHDALLPPIWRLISGYFQDVELRMMASLALMPGGKWHNYSHGDNDTLPVSEEMKLIYVGAMNEREDEKLFKYLHVGEQIRFRTVDCFIPEEFIFAYEAAMHGCINVILWDQDQKPPHLLELTAAVTESALKIGAVMSNNTQILDWVRQQKHYLREDWNLSMIILAFMYQKIIAFRG